MENVRAIVNEHCNIIQQIIHEEADHWKEIHAIMDQYVLMFSFRFFFNFYIIKKFN
jgi:hypothetical protein